MVGFKFGMSKGSNLVRDSEVVGPIHFENESIKLFNNRVKDFFAEENIEACLPQKCHKKQR